MAILSHIIETPNQMFQTTRQNGIACNFRRYVLVVNLLRNVLTDAAKLEFLEHFFLYFFLTLFVLVNTFLGHLLGH